EGGGMAELRMLALEGLQNAHRAVGIGHPLTVLLDQLELPGRGVIEGEDDRCRPSGNADPSVKDVVESDQAVAALPQSLPITPEVGRGAGPTLLGHVDLVVLSDHDP